jgi:hypothetical protein
VANAYFRQFAASGPFPSSSSLSATDLVLLCMPRLRCGCSQPYRQTKNSQLTRPGSARPPIGVGVDGSALYLTALHLRSSNVSRRDYSKKYEEAQCQEIELNQRARHETINTWKLSTATKYIILLPATWPAASAGRWILYVTITESANAKMADKPSTQLPRMYHEMSFRSCSFCTVSIWVTKALLNG